MQVSKKEILDQIEYHVRAYQRAFLNVGDELHEYTRANAYVHSLKVLFSGSKAISAACDAAAERLTNIFLNGDVEDYSRLGRDEQPDAYELAADAAIAKQDAQSGPVASVHIQGNDFEEVLTESDFEPEMPVVNQLVNCAGLTSRDLFEIWTSAPQCIARHRNRTRSARQKNRRGVRFSIPIHFVSERVA